MKYLIKFSKSAPDRNLKKRKEERNNIKSLLLLHLNPRVTKIVEFIYQVTPFFSFHSNFTGMKQIN